MKEVLQLNGKNLCWFQFTKVNEDTTSALVKDDKELVLVAVNQCGWALEFASEELRNEEEVVKAAIEQYRVECEEKNRPFDLKDSPLKHASKELQEKINPTSPNRFWIF